MENRRKETKEKYFEMIGYDIAMYTQHGEELQRDTVSSKQLTHGAYSHSGNVRHSQEDNYSIREM